MTPRPYQAEAINAVNDWLPNNDGNPCVVIPTGGGKTPTMAWLIEQWLTAWSDTRVLVLAHVKELLAQGVEKMREIWPWAPVGIYSAGLNGRDMHQPITYAGIQSIWRRACDFDPFDVIMVDEAHRIPVADDGTYRKFLADAKLVNPKIRVIGWTATPYRLSGGPICGPDKILNEVIYEAGVRNLIDAGYLSRLKSKGADATIDTAGVAIRKGEFVTGQIEPRAAEKVPAAIHEAMQMLAGRRAILFFCVSIAHAQQVAAELCLYGVVAPVVSNETPGKERDRILEEFKAGRIRAVCNVNVLSEGFDAQRVDAVVMLRPTASPGLYYQQVGRGLRLFDGKTDCLVLDFAGNIARHGPIDDIKPGHSKKPGSGESGPPPLKRCPNCKEMIYTSALVCMECGHEFPPPEIKHEATAASTPILSTPEPWTVDVKEVRVDRHQRDGKPPSLKVTYIGDFEQHTEWVCLQHGEFAGHKARKWWQKRFGEPVPNTVDEAMLDLFLGHKLRSLTNAVTVRKVGKYTEVINVSLKDEYKALTA